MRGGARTRTTEQTFFEKVMPVTESGCWLWTGHLKPNGYGECRFGGVLKLAHRASYEFIVGPIPAGLCLDHLCRVRSCVNPAHLEPVTLVENLMRGLSPGAINSKKTHCKYGHEFSEENTYTWKGIKRLCRKCTAIRDKLKNEKRKAARHANKIQNC